MKSAFLKFFVAQHGPRARDARSDEELRDAIAAGEWARQEMRARTEWDARHQSALYAWNARVDTADSASGG